LDVKIAFTSKKSLHIYANVVGSNRENKNDIKN
jgi:hypothetical protein